MTTITNDPYAALGSRPSVAEALKIFNASTDMALGWAIEAFDDGLLAPDEFVTFCRDLKNFHDPYAWSVTMTAWAEEVKNRLELAQTSDDISSE